MKKVYFILLSLVMLCASCDKCDYVEEGVASEDIKLVSFKCSGNFSGAMELVTRASSLSVNELGLTDLWVFDYLDDVYVQNKHQVYGVDDGFGYVTLPLKRGRHKLYFVASKGNNPVVSESSSTISFSNVRDTFWKCYELNVTSSSSNSESITLERVVTKLNVEFNETIPDNASFIKITPSQWYRGINYKTGFGVATTQPLQCMVSIPDMYKGNKEYNLQVEIYGFVPSNNYSTNIEIAGITGTGSDSAIDGYVAIPNAPFTKNRMTKYIGTVYTNVGNTYIETALSIDNTWSTPYEL